MKACTFFGHGDCPETVRQRLYAVAEDLIVNQGVELFYVGNHGRYDAISKSVVKELKERYPWITYAVVLAYMPGKKNGNTKDSDEPDTVLPEGIEHVHPRYAISWRNNWMLKQSDYVIAYILHSWGGAAQYVKKAQKQGKVVLNLAVDEKG